MKLENIMARVSELKPDIWKDDLEEEVKGDIDIAKYIEPTRPPDKIAEGIARFLNDIIIRYKINMIVTVERKATAIFRGVKSRFGGLTNLAKCDFSTNEEEEKLKTVSGKNVLIFDDGFHTGVTIKKEIKHIQKYNPSFIACFSVVASGTVKFDDVITKNVRLSTMYVVPDDMYSNEFNQIMLGLFDFLEQSPMKCQGKKNIKISDEESVARMIVALAYNPSTSIRRVPNLLDGKTSVSQKKEVLKGHVDFDKIKDVDKGKIFSNIPLDIKVQQCKIRYYFYMNEKYCSLILLPIVHASFSTKGCNKKWCACPQKDLGKVDEKMCSKCIQDALESRLSELFCGELFTIAQKNGIKLSLNGF